MTLDVRNADRTVSSESLSSNQSLSDTNSENRRVLKPYYEHAGITIYHGDCGIIAPLVCADVFITDPPYGVNLQARVTKHSVRRGTYTAFEDTEEYVRNVAVPVVQYLVNAGMRGAVTPGTKCLRYYPIPADIGVIWSPAGAGKSAWGFQCSHPILYYGKCPYLAAGDGSRPNGMSWNNATEENGHPCPKPLPVMNWLVNRVSLFGETILDPFCGSGTTLVAAKNNGRKAIGIEIEEKYCEIAAKRLSQEVLDFSGSST